MPVAHNDQAAAGTEHLLHLGGNKCYAYTVFGQLQDQLLDLQFGTYVNTAGRLVQDQIIRMGQKPSGQDHLLLVSAAEGSDGGLPAGSLDIQRLDVFLRKRLLIRCG